MIPYPQHSASVYLSGENPSPYGTKSKACPIHPSNITALKKNNISEKYQGTPRYYMETILLDYGVLGCWVIFSIIRERFLLKKLEEQNENFLSERGKWYDERERWLRTLGRKLSDRTIDETIGRR